MITNEVVTDPSILDPLSTPEETLPQRPPPSHADTRVGFQMCWVELEASISCYSGGGLTVSELSCKLTRTSASLTLLSGDETWHAGALEYIKDNEFLGYVLPPTRGG